MKTNGNQFWFGSMKARGETQRRGFLHSTLCLITLVMAWGVSPTGWAATTNYYNDGGVHFFAGDYIVSSQASNNFSYVGISNGSILTNSGEGGISYNGNTISNTVYITGPGSAWNQSGNLSISYIGNVGRLTITNGAAVHTGGVGYIGRYPGYGMNDLVKVTGPGSTWNLGVGLYVGASGLNDQLVIENGATVTNNGYGYIGSSGSNDVLRVDGAGSVYFQSGDMLRIGFSQQGNNQLIVTNGGKVVSPAGQITYGIFAPFGAGNSAIVTGSGSVWSNSGQVYIGGYTGTSNVVNTVTVTDGGALYATAVTAGSGTDYNKLLVTSGGLVEANTLLIGNLAGFTNNAISNIGGIYQFTAAPTIAPGQGSISVTDGTVSFRGVTNAPVTGLTGLQYNGDNTFRLNNSTNAAVGTYTFNSAANTGNPTNYQRLSLINGGGWRGTTLNIGAGGDLLVSNSISSVNAALVSSGSIHVVNSKVTFASNVVVSGSYVSDPSTSTYLQNLTVTANGSLAGGSGDVFDFKKSFYNQSTNSALFNLTASTVSFSGGGIHTNSVTGVDLGHDATHGYPNGFLATNFGYYKLTLASASDVVYFTGGNGASSNALYITDLDLAGLTNSFANATDMITNLFRSTASVNIYYTRSDVTSFNTYLNDQVFQLSDLGGGAGGFLMPAVPEPSVLLLVTCGLGMLIRRKTRGQ